MKYSWIKRVCVIDSSYSLLLYFLLSSKEEIESTFFFWSNGVPEAVRSYFYGKSFYFATKCQDEQTGIFQNIWQHLKQLFQYYVGYYVKFPFLIKKNISYWGHCHLGFSPNIIHGNKIHLIEDGLDDYSGVRPTLSSNKLSNYFFYGPLGVKQKYRFQQRTVDEVFLTGLNQNSPAMHSNKTIVISLNSLWEESSSSKRDFIKQIYNLTEEDLIRMNECDAVLFTQTFSEDMIVSEEEKILMYKNVLKNIDCSKLIIKPHPRETTDYKKHFPQATVFSKKIPTQLLKLCGISFKTAYTVFSSAVLGFESSNVVFWGSEINQKILNRYPEYTSEKLYTRYSLK